MEPSTNMRLDHPLLSHGYHKLGLNHFLRDERRYKPTLAPASDPFTLTDALNNLTCAVQKATDTAAV